jgi:putative tryptophan/tyrosine transport system substrate-binding protein
LVRFRLHVFLPSEFEDAFSAIRSDRPDAILTTSDSLSFPNRGVIIDLALKNRLPVMAAFREFTEIGGLISYGSVRVDRFRRAALYVGKILKGAKPADLPVEQPSKYELVINLKTARSLDLEIHHDLLLIADEVVE